MRKNGFIYWGKWSNDCSTAAFYCCIVSMAINSWKVKLAWSLLHLHLLLYSDLFRNIRIKVVLLWRSSGSLLSDWAQECMLMEITWKYMIRELSWMLADQRDFASFRTSVGLRGNHLHTAILTQPANSSLAVNTITPSPQRREAATNSCNMFTLISVKTESALQWSVTNGCYWAMAELLFELFMIRALKMSIYLKKNIYIFL